MNCREYQERVQDWLDGGPSPTTDPAAGDHLAGCHFCRQLGAVADHLRRKLQSLPPAQVPGGFAERAVARIERERRRLRIRRFQWVSSGLAASVLLALALLWWRPGTSPAPLPELTVAPNATTAPTLPAPAPPAIAERPPEPARGPESLPSLRAELDAVRATWDLTRAAARERAQSAGLLVPRFEPPVAGAPPVELDRPFRPVQDVTRSVSENLEPVAHSARRALTVFRQMLPPAEPKSGS
jgi:hypothetical protein